jgi:hypothetical protein
MSLLVLKRCWVSELGVTDEWYDVDRTRDDSAKHSAVVDARLLMVRNRDFELPPKFECIDVREQFAMSYDALVELLSVETYFFQNPEELERFERERGV